MVVFGGTGIQRERSAAGVGLCCPKWNPLVVNGTFEQEGRFVSEYGVRMEDIGRSLNGNWDILCEGGKCNPCAEKIIGWYLTKDNQSAILSAESHDTFTDLYSEYYYSANFFRAFFIWNSKFWRAEFSRKIFKRAQILPSFKTLTSNVKLTFSWSFLIEYSTKSNPKK